MDWVTAATATGFLLVAIGISGRRYSALTVLGGLGVIGLGIVGRLFTGGGLLSVGFELFRDAGLALVLAAAWLSMRKPQQGIRAFFVLGLLSLTLAGALFLVNRAVNRSASDETASIVVELGPDDDISEVADVLRRHKATAEEAFPSVLLDEDADLAQMYLVHVPSDRATALMAVLRADVENVDHVELNSTVELSPVVPGTTSATVEREFLENDPFVGQQWALEAIRGHEVHAMLQNTTPARKARVAILDTGVEGDHEDLAEVLATAGASDVHGHGTHCAGIAGAATNNGLGIASLNWEGRFIELLAFEALGSAGRGSLEQIAQAIVDATQADVDVISMSLGSAAQRQPRVLVSAVAFALRNDVIVIASAGNDDEDAINHFPSNIDGVIAVAAVDQELSKARFSNTVGSLGRPIAAPGVDIVSSYLNGEYKPLSGTSMATPVVSGLVGMMRALNPDLDAETAYAILHETGTDLDATSQVGRLVNAEAAIERVLSR